MPDSTLREVFRPELHGDRTLAAVLCAVAALALIFRFGFSIRLLLATALVCVLVFLALFDARNRRLPDCVVLPLAVGGLAAAVISQFCGVDLVPLVPIDPAQSASPLVSSLAGGLLGMFVPLAIDLFYALIRKRSGLGAGDIKLLAAIGLFVGPYVVLVLLLGSIAGVVWGIGLLVARRDSGGMFPFGPFLVGATLFVLMCGPELFAGYDTHALF